MKIKLKSLHLINFMAYADRIFTFGDVTKISGKNGIGKSSICTAYSWLMFDTDLELHSNPKVRREVGGQPINDIDVSVEAVFDIDGKEVTARKVQKRTFSKDKSSYKDDNSYFINEVPKTLKAFNEYFGVDMKLLQMCSNINAFLSKNSKEIREYLFSKVEDITDLDIAKKFKELSELVPLLERYTAEEIEKMHKATKSKVDKEIPILAGQIMEKSRDIAENSDIDVAELELARKGIKEKIADIKEKQLDFSKQYEEYHKQSKDVLEMKFQLSDLDRKASEELVKQKRALQSKIDEKSELLENASRDEYRNSVGIEKCQDNIENAEAERKRLLEKWNSVNKETFDESSAVCPTCHRELPQEERERLLEEFEQSKRKRIDEIEKSGLRAKKDINSARELMEELQSKNKAISADKSKFEKEVEDLEKQLAELPSIADVCDTEEHNLLQSLIDEKEAALQKSDSANEISKSLSVELSEAEEQLLEIEKKIALSDTSKAEERLEELKKQRIDLEQSKANCEKILDLLSELDKRKNESLSESINSLFGIVDWKLYEYNKSGGYKSVCVPMLDGKSILDISSNKGNRILGRLDIINSIQKIEEINCLVFLDDAESLDAGNIAKAVEMLDCQVILLEVTEDSELRIS